MGKPLDGKRAFVSGSSSGIGAEIAAELGRHGATVCVHGRDRIRGEMTADNIRAEGGVAHLVIGDLESDESVASLVRSIEAAVGGIDVLVNCAGAVGEGNLTWDNSTIDQWLGQFQLNTLGAVRLIQAMIPAMRAQHWGRIIQIGSIVSAYPLPNQVPAYCASKAALNTVTVSLSKTVAGDGVTVNTVSPGFVLTPLLQQYYLGMPEYAGRDWDEIEPGIANSLGIGLGRLGRPEDIAGLVAFLAGPGGEWVTGSNFRIDGGTAGYVD